MLSHTECKQTKAKGMWLIFDGKSLKVSCSSIGRWEAVGHRTAQCRYLSPLSPEPLKTSVQVSGACLPELGLESLSRGTVPLRSGVGGESKSDGASQERVDQRELLPLPEERWAAPSPELPPQSSGLLWQEVFEGEGAWKKKGTFLDKMEIRIKTAVTTDFTDSLNFLKALQA